MFNQTVFFLVFGLGALCVLLGFVLVVRGVGGTEGEAKIKVLGLEFGAAKSGPGVIFALFGSVLVVVALVKQPASPSEPGAVPSQPRDASVDPSLGLPESSEVTKQTRPETATAAQPAPLEKVRLRTPSSVNSERAGPPASTTVSTAVGWLRKPTRAEIHEYYPPLAATQGVYGRVLVECLVDRNGEPYNCKVTSGAPEGYGFSGAALKLANLFTFIPQTVDGIPSDRGVVTIPISFNADPSTPP